MQEYGDWIVEGELGKGDFATVYRVRRDDAIGAAKVCRPGDELASHRHGVELANLMKLDHPSIPKVLDHGTEGASSYFVMTYAPGVTLRREIESRVSRGTVFGDIEVLRILKALLAALAHSHHQNIVHRDIKDANIIYDLESSHITVLDFGFSQQAGMHQIRSADSFWRVGAARFSPPAKLDDPSLSVAAHDVFAIGVVGYRLLTAEFPWSVGEHEGLVALKKAQHESPLRAIFEINSLVVPPVARFVERLLTLVDDQRPSAAEAAAKGTELLGNLERQLASGTKVVRGRPRVAYPHVIRDPLYGDIRVTDFEFKVLNTREMQRLRWIRQLGLTSLVYPGADHSRLSHSIGCVQVVETMLRHMELQEGVSIEPEVRLTARLYALTHDFPHVAFGHTLEDEFGFWERHDKNVARHDRLITSEASELGTMLGNSEVGREVLVLLDPGGDETDQHMAYDLVLGLTGADVLDYVNRDALFCGLMHRIDDAIYRQFRLQPVIATESRRLISLMGGKYGVRVDREFAVETILQERYAMFLKVYCHSAKIAASCVLANALSMELTRARRPRRGRTDSLQEESFEWLGDEAVLRLLAGSTSTSVKRLAKMVLDRRIPPGVYRAWLLSPEERNESAYDDRRGDFRTRDFLTPPGRAQLEQEISKRSGVGVDKIMVYCPARAPGYQRVEHWVSERRTETAKRRAPSSFSSILSRHLGLWEFWAFVLEGSERDKRAVAEATEELVMRTNVIDQYRRENFMF